MKWVHRRFFAFYCLLLVSLKAVALPVESALKIQGYSASYYSNRDLSLGAAEVDQAVIVVHGSERNADTYYNTMEEVIASIGLADSTLIIAPHFKEPSDLKRTEELYFDSEGWLRGDGALNNSRITSFDVLDEFLKLLLDPGRFPRLKTIVFTGHSAGGQTTQRYALATSLVELNPGVRFHFVVVNPGSYTYLNKDRPSPEGTFKVPTVPLSCAYNHYKFGLEQLNAYLLRTPATRLVPRYLRRDVTYLLGEADTQVDELDQSCEAEAQGHTRFERGSNFKAYLDEEFPWNRHSLITVPGIGHTEWGIYNSESGKGALFPSSFDLE